MSLLVLDPGLFSLMVDRGRSGSRALGMPLGGAADRAAFALANALVGNPPDAPALELTRKGPTLRAEHRTGCVVFGANFAPAVNGTPRPAGATLTLEPGDQLQIGETASGLRGYLCIAGGFDVPAILGSRSALEPVKTSDVLLGSPSQMAGRSLPNEWRGFSSSSERVLRVLAGSQRDWFTDDTFFTTAYTATTASNRMGLRLQGASLERRAGELISEAIAPGAVQVANDGQPIVLGVDGQTLGGYPKIAHVIRADLDKLAQLRPGDQVRFQSVTIEEAEAVARARAKIIRGWLTRLKATF